MEQRFPLEFNYYFRDTKNQNKTKNKHHITCPQHAIEASAESMVNQQLAIVNYFECFDPINHRINGGGNGAYFPISPESSPVHLTTAASTSISPGCHENIVNEYKPYDEVRNKVQPLVLHDNLDKMADEAFYKILVAFKDDKLERLPDEFKKIVEKYQIDDQFQDTGIFSPVPVCCESPPESRNVVANYIDHRVKTEMVPIGDGFARVPVTVLNEMNWNSYTTCTRKLLTTIFPRSVLATHSLDGKLPPAYPGSHDLKILDPFLINDIIKIVMEKCGVTESQVRMSISTKCADESRMFRTRVQRSRNTESEQPSATTSTRTSNEFSVLGLVPRL